MVFRYLKGLVGSGDIPGARMKRIHFLHLPSMLIIIDQICIRVPRVYPGVLGETCFVRLVRKSDLDEFERVWKDSIDGQPQTI
jgi:hypothetical protein